MVVKSPVGKSPLGKSLVAKSPVGKSPYGKIMNFRNFSLTNENKFLDKLFVARREGIDVSKKKEVIVSLMYLGKISIELRKRLPLISK